MSKLPSTEALAKLARIRVVLVDTREPANIGAAARALKTMGLSQLALVRPAHFPHGHASKLALAAIDVLDRARVYATLPEAIADCHGVWGISARQRRLALPASTPRVAAASVLDQAHGGHVALVFGGEEAGLSNADLACCSTLVQIPSDPECRSLNLAAAVQLIAYEVRMAALSTEPPAAGPAGTPVAAFEQMLQALDQALLDSGYYRNKNPALALEKLRRILQRGVRGRADIQLLRGVISRWSKREN